MTRYVKKGRKKMAISIALRRKYVSLRSLVRITLYIEPHKNSIKGMKQRH
jgi:hypothetical protein